MRFQCLLSRAISLCIEMNESLVLRSFIAVREVIAIAFSFRVNLLDRALSLAFPLDNS